MRLKKGFSVQHYRQSIDRYSYQKTHFSPRLLPSSTKERARSCFAHVRRHLWRYRGVVVSISSTSAGVAYASLARDFNDLVPSFSDRRYLTSVTRVPVFITLNHFLDWQIWKYRAVYRGILLIFVKWRRMKNCGDPIRVKNRRNDRGRRLLQTVEHVCARYIESADRK